jgi:uncharacterized glyoxalase superfamily protein PhnB
MPVISLMLAGADAPTAVAWYKRALGATELSSARRSFSAVR